MGHVPMGNGRIFATTLTKPASFTHCSSLGLCVSAEFDGIEGESVQVPWIRLGAEFSYALGEFARPVGKNAILVVLSIGGRVEDGVKILEFDPTARLGVSDLISDCFLANDEKLTCSSGASVLACMS